MNDEKRSTAHLWRMASVLTLALGAPALAHAGGDKLKAMDSNNDGMVSATEHNTAMTTKFGEMDANGDGNVTAAEMDAKHGMKMKPKEPITSNDASTDAPMPREMSSADTIAKMDINGDGMLSVAEHNAGIQSKFSDMDTDGNGSLSQQELAQGKRK